MIDLNLVIYVIAFLLGLGAGSAAFITGSVIGERRARRLALETYCDGCEHHLSFHDADGKCRYHDYSRCRCQRYIGPRPVGELEEA